MYILHGSVPPEFADVVVVVPVVVVVVVLMPVVVGAERPHQLEGQVAGR